MKVLLINQNATIDRLVTLSTGKLLFELTKSDSIQGSAPGEYDFVIVDSDVFEEEAFSGFKSECGDATFLMILSKGLAKPSGFDVFIEKPFLPTELVDILSTNRSVAPSFEAPKFEESFSPSLDEDDDIPSLDDLELSSDSPSDSLDMGEIMTLDDTELGEHTFDVGDEIKLDEMDSLDSFGTDEIKLDDLDLSDSAAEVEADALPGSEEISLDGLDFGADVGEDEVKMDEGDDSFSIDDFKLDDSDTEAETTDTGGMDEIELDGFGDLSLDMEEPAKDEKQEDMLLEDSVMSDDIAGLGDSEISFDEESDVSEEDELLGALDELNDGLQGVQADDEVSLAFEEHEEKHSEDEEEEVKVPSSIFGEDEVKKLKDLLDEADGQEDAFDPSEVRMENDELGSLTEESLAEALGVELDDNNDGGDLSEIGLENLDAPSAAPQPSVSPAAQNVEMSATDLFSIPLDKLKMLLDTADITVNITLSKKR